MMNNSIIAHSLNGVTVEQRTIDGYLNATRLAKAYEREKGIRKDVRDWLLTERAKKYTELVSAKTGLSVKELVQVKKGGNKPGTWLHPRLADPFATWLSVEYEYQVSEWLEEWRNLRLNHFKPQKPQVDLERLEERLNLKNIARLALTDICKEWMEYQGWYNNKPRVTKYFATLMDGINIAITTETSQQMTKRLSALKGKPMKSDDLIRDYFPVEALRVYLHLHTVLTNMLLEQPIGDRDAIKYLSNATRYALPPSFKASRIEFCLLPYNVPVQMELLPG